VVVEIEPAQRLIASQRLDLVWMSPEFIRASLEGREADAAMTLGVRLPQDWPSDAAVWLKHRLDQMVRDHSQAEWLIRAIVSREDGAMAGHITFHGRAEDGRAELGYTVFEEYRRRGYATEATMAMMKWAAARHGVRTFVLSISPENEASLGVARKLGFEQTGSQIDDVDGLELVFERPWRGGTNVAIVAGRD
jgi:RimJ/RimL family protein N-acetyltransferase